MANAFNRLCHMLFLNQVLIRFNVEKRLSASALETGVVSATWSYVKTSENESLRPLSRKKECRLVAVDRSSLAYKIFNSVRSFPLQLYDTLGMQLLKFLPGVSH